MRSGLIFASILLLSGCSEVEKPQQPAPVAVAHDDWLEKFRAVPEFNPPNASRTPEIVQLYMLRGSKALVCDNASYLAPLIQPNAREVLGEFNFMRIAQDGRCVEIGNNRLLRVCEPQQGQIAAVSQYLGEHTFSRCAAIRASDLGPKAGTIEW